MYLGLHISRNVNLSMFTLDTFVLVKCTYFIVWISDGRRGYGLITLLCFALSMTLAVENVIRQPAFHSDVIDKSCRPLAGWRMRYRRVTSSCQRFAQCIQCARRKGAFLLRYKSESLQKSRSKCRQSHRVRFQSLAVVCWTTDSWRIARQRCSFVRSQTTRNKRHGSRDEISVGRKSARLGHRRPDRGIFRQARSCVFRFP